MASIKMKKTYYFPSFLKGLCDPVKFDKWLERKARSHVARDRKKGVKDANRKAYKEAMHKAIVESGGLDQYTGKKLAWRLISSWENEESKKGRKKYKKKFGDLPSIDHVEDKRSEHVFRMCSWRVNDCKNDLTIDEFLEVCKDVIKYSRERSNKQKKRRCPFYS